MGYFDKLNKQADVIDIDEWLKQQNASRNQPSQKKKGFWTDQISTGGGIGGSLAGAATGAAIGSVVPGIGTVIGGLAGGVLGGALGSGGGEFAENVITGEEDKFKNVGQEALLGGIFSAPPVRGAKVAYGLLKGGGKAAVEKAIVGGGAGVAGKVASGVADRATTNFLKLTPAQTQKLLDAGIDPSDLARRGMQFGKNAEDIIGRTGTKGPLQETIRAAERGIQQAATTAGKNIRIPGDDLIKALQAEAKVIKSELGSSARSGQIDKIIADAKKKYAKGFTVSQGLSTLRSANERFGASVLDDAGDAVARAAQKLEANTIRSALKSRFPSIQQGLDDQSSLIQLREILKKTRAKDITGGFKTGKLDLSRPGTLIDPALNSGVVSRAALGATAPKAAVPMSNLQRSTGGVVPTIARQGIGQNVFGNPGFKEPNLEDALMQGQDGQQEQFGEQMQQEQSPYGRENLMYDIQRDPKNADKYIAYYQQIQEIFGQPESQLTSSQQTRAAAAQNALQDIPLIEDAINSGQLGGLKAIPGAGTAVGRSLLGTENLDAALFNIADNILRARSGAAAPEAEVKRFVNTFLPGPLDSMEAKRAKLERAVRELQGFTNPAQAAQPGLEDALMNIQGGF